LEYRESSEDILWDLQGWYGSDYHKFWWKTEGEVAHGSIESAELQLLYSHAWTPFFDWQAGIRVTDLDTSSVAWGAFGVQGMAPYRFEIDAAAFVSSEGNLALRAEFEREFLFTEKLVLQPRAEINWSSDGVPRAGVGSSGANALALEARLRYEFTRKFAPYLGLAWETSYGETADYLRDNDLDTSDTTAVVGLRFWFP
jgi:copper resistance protein B